MNEQFKYEIVKKWQMGQMLKQIAEVKLGITRRQVNQLLISYRNYG